jgi:hypothetical protein
MEKSMESIEERQGPEFPFPVPTYRFNQRNEMFKRNVWDEKNRPLMKSFSEVKYQSKVGYRKIDYAWEMLGATSVSMNGMVFPKG